MITETEQISTSSTFFIHSELVQNINIKYSKHKNKIRKISCSAAYITIVMCLYIFSVMFYALSTNKCYVW